MKKIIKYFSDIKDNLTDAPSEVKEDFNKIVKYFHSLLPANSDKTDIKYFMREMSLPFKDDKAYKEFQSMMEECELYKRNYPHPFSVYAEKGKKVFLKIEVMSGVEIFVIVGEKNKTLTYILEDKYSARGLVEWLKSNFK